MKLDLLTVRVPEWLNNMQLFLCRFDEGVQYITGKISFADFLLYEQLITLEYLDKDLLKNYPFLQAYIARMEARPNMAAYLASGKRPLMVNNKPNGTPKEFLDMKAHLDG